MNTLIAKDIKLIFDSLAGIMEEKKQWLIELDGAMGDGDLGLTMSTGFRKASEALKDFEENDVGKIVAKGGMVIAQSVPSTMGTLMATGFMKGGKAIQGKEEINLTDLAEMMEAFVEGIMMRGKSKPGDKTVIDSLYPACNALKSASTENKTMKEGLALACEAAERGVEQTKEMVSKHGRAAYYQEKSVGRQDPGATVGMLIIKAFNDYVSANS